MIAKTEGKVDNHRSSLQEVQNRIPQTEAEIENLHKGGSGSNGGPVIPVPAQAVTPLAVLLTAPELDDTVPPQTVNPPSHLKDDDRGLGKWFKVEKTKKTLQETSYQSGWLWRVEA